MSKARRTTPAKTPALAPKAVTPLDVTTRDAEGKTPLHWAAFYGYTTTVRQMLQQEAEVDARDEQARTPGHWSAFKGHLAVVKVLVEFGADVNARDTEGRTMLKMALIGQKNDVEQFLRTRGAEV
jgi:ankyrin repeat protein